MSGTSASYSIRVRPCLGQWHRYEITFFEFKLRAQGSSAKSITLSTVFGIL
ncbi:hypothetical protein F383_23005 [Gossypium arboreum]|uniref:Uncharacterized protein n=1 Tax=Gossypium arboreum TaxID=29729 RepID=A0A0B0NSS0_GOSAR|nr:hypothetical protein F383_23005 [Gossypium arboreum]